MYISRLKFCVGGSGLTSCYVCCSLNSFISYCVLPSQNIVCNHNIQPHCMLFPDFWDQHVAAARDLRAVKLTKEKTLTSALSSFVKENLTTICFSWFKFNLKFNKMSLNHNLCQPRTLSMVMSIFTHLLCYLLVLTYGLCLFVF